MASTQSPLCMWELRPQQHPQTVAQDCQECSRVGHRPLPQAATTSPPPGLPSCVPAPAPYFPKKVSPFVPAPALPLGLGMGPGLGPSSSLSTQTTIAPRDAAVVGRKLPPWGPCMQISACSSRSGAKAPQLAICAKVLPCRPARLTLKGDE